ncbi:copper resistance protein CopB [Oleiagrimonas soli]|nr:copper resistance protein CopB [Oleiagrimonas soli]
MKQAGGDAMQGMSMGAMQGGSAPPDARDPDYSDGLSFAPDHDVHMHGDSRFGMLSVDRLEYVHTDHADGAALEGQAWYGGDLDRAVLAFEAESSGGRVHDSRVEALWSHAVSAYWDTRLGVRQDGGDGPSRTWAAFGVQGLAPYWFDVQAELYAGPSGRTAARVEVEYDVLFTQRLILTPKVELNAYGKDDPARGIARGVSSADMGLRLRYEIRRRFAPYVGVAWTRRLGASAGLARRQGEPVLERKWVAGVRLWF